MFIKRKKVLSWSLTVVISLLLCGGGIAYAKVTGVCANCHTMHNSQDGADLSVSPNDFLLKGGCVGCHTGTNTGANTTPYVMDTIAPILTTKDFGGNTLAGGNFWWVSQPGGDAKGHNVMGIAGQDSKITVAAGAPGGAVVCADSCHMTLAVEQQTIFTELGSGCQGCHLNVMHHDDGPGTQYVGASPWYRFLSGHNSGSGKGVTGIEDNDWQYSCSKDDHNEYLGVVGPDKTGTGGFFNLDNTMTAFCTGCHGNFHIQDGTATGASPWLRHPSDFVIPNSGEYAAMSTVYNPDTPVARASLDAGGATSNLVTPGTDMVMCLSCHYAHGSPYDDILRWDYTTIIAGGGANDKGCFVCHTTKDDL